jgi:signal transduction histidine kinase
MAVGSVASVEMRVNLGSRAGSVALCIVAVAMCAVTGVVTASGSSSESAWLQAVARMLTVAAPLAVGIFALRRPPFARFGGLLVIAGGVWFLTTLANAQDATLYSIGRVGYWLFEPLVIYLLLAFPTGRLDRRFDRVLVWIAVGIVLVLYLPTALVVEGYPVPSPVDTCGAGCPANAFMVSGSEPAVIEDVVRPLRELLTFVFFGVVAVRLGQRIRGATPLTRRARGPVLAVACFRCAAFCSATLGRRLAPESSVVDVSMWLLAAAVPLTAVAFLAGLLRWWVFMARSTQRLVAKLGAHPTPEDVRLALAEAFDDRSLAIMYWLGDGDGHWGDADGHRLDPPSAGPGRAVTKVVDGDRLVAAIVHDSALRDERAFVDAATSYAVMTFDHHRLAAETSSLLHAVRDSRTRIQTAADDERRRIERDLHDGAQQRLIALRIRLELAAEVASKGPRSGAAEAAALRRFGDDVEEALRAVRSLASGIYPATLADHGLVAALRAAALENQVPTTVLAAGVRRHSPEIESAVYFCCLEALQNTAKHARGASAAVIELWDEESLQLEVRDDGAGFDAENVMAGVGFTSMRDRLAAMGGKLTITSSPGRGTRVCASIPIPAEQR